MACGERTCRGRAKSEIVSVARYSALVSQNEHSEESADDDAENHDDAEERIALTPEQKANLARALEGIHQSLARNIEPPNFKLPESIFKNIFAASRIFESQQSVVARAIRPMFAMQPPWQKQFASISSDIFKTYSLGQPNLNLLASQLTKNIDFSAFAGAARIAQQFTTHQATWLKNIAPVLASVRAAFYPPNLRSIEGLEFEEVEQVSWPTASHSTDCRGRRSPKR